MARWLFFALTFVTALLSFASPAVAQPGKVARVDTLVLTRSQARARALRDNPDLLAAQLDTAVARGRYHQARVIRFNPTAELLARPNGESMEAGVSQEIEIFGQRGTRMAAGRAGLERAAAGVMNATRLVIGDVDRAFYRLASATQRTKLSEEVLALNVRLADIAGRQLTQGEISRLDFNLVLVELGRDRARTIAARREQEQTAIELRRLLGLPRDTPVSAALDSLPTLAVDTGHGVPGDARPSPDSAPSLDVDQLTAHALARRPDLVERSAAIRQAQANVSLSRREALPNPVLRGLMEQPTRGGPRTLRPGIGVTLPFLNRNQGERQALRAAERQAGLEHAALVTMVRAEVASAVTSYASAASEARILERTVLAPARQNRQLVEIAYREGKVGLPVLLLIQNQAIDAELEYWTAWLAAREALANLAEATAQNIDDLQGTDMRIR